MDQEALDKAFQLGAELSRFAATSGLPSARAWCKQRQNLMYAGCFSKFSSVSPHADFQEYVSLLNACLEMQCAPRRQQENRKLAMPRSKRGPLPRAHTGSGSLAWAADLQSPAAADVGVRASSLSGQSGIQQVEWNFSLASIIIYVHIHICPFPKSHSFRRCLLIETPSVSEHPYAVDRLIRSHAG